jgi:hypothetical protein
VLSHSRKAYSEAVTRQTTEAFIRALENAFAHFGGVPRRVVLDNLKAAVKQADWFDPELNPKVQEFARHYGTIFWPTRPYTPRHKGKVERGVGYVKNNALKGRTFASLDEQNLFLQEWERTVADTRIHGTTRRQVGPYFAAVEKPVLAPLPPARFPCFQESRRVVNRDGHIEIGRAYYSAPPEYLARRVWVRWDGRLVRLFNDRFEQIAVHVQREPGRFSTQQKHIVAEKISSVERGAAWILGRIRRVGPHCARWAEACVQARGVEGVRVLQGLLSLTHRRSVAAIERACEIAQSYGAYRLRTVRRLIDWTRRCIRSPFATTTRSSALSPITTSSSMTPFRKELRHDRPPDLRPEATAALRAAAISRCPLAGSGRQQPQPRRVPGTDPPGRTGRPLRPPVAAAGQGRQLPRTEDPRCV